MMENPFLMAFIKFAILGSLGELVAKLIQKKKIKLLQILYSALVWGLLGMLIKYMFTGMNFMVAALTDYGYLPAGSFYSAFFKSFFTNAMFGPWVIIIHRFLDSLITGKPGVPSEGLLGALKTLLWFWLPAHTITFMMGPDMQITLAAVWSFVLGLILGIYNNKKK